MNPNLEKEYSEEEYKRELLPYKMYLNSIEEVFDFSIIDSMADFGCANGRLIEAVKRKYSHIEVLGIDYFDWALKYADETIKDKIKLMDLSKKQDFGKKFDLVNCSELGEHIKRKEEEIFINNLINATKNILVLTWSNLRSSDNDQHQNPRPKKYIINKIKGKGLVYWEEATEVLSNALSKNLIGVGYSWWSDNILVFKKVNFFRPKSTYLIQNINSDDATHKIVHNKRGLYYKSLQESFIELKDLIISLSARRKSTTILRASDGDYYFLRKIEIGSAKPGKRALTKSYDQVNIPLFRSLFWQNDIITVSIEKKMHNSWKKYIFYDLADKIFWKLNFKLKGKNIFKYIHYIIDLTISPIISRKFFLIFVSWITSLLKGHSYKNKARKIINKRYIPMECVYASVANKWIFRNFRNQIGIIGAGSKLGLIRKLTEYKQYRNYIGVDYFSDYIEVPQIGAADDVFKLSQEIGKKIMQSQAKIFLVGVGSAKIALMPLLKAYSDAIFIDVGCGIDALAGIVCQERPYFADWVNYRIKSYDYSKVDFMDKDNPACDNKGYKTIYLN